MAASPFRHRVSPPRRPNATASRSFLHRNSEERLLAALEANDLARSAWRNFSLSNRIARLRRCGGKRLPKRARTIRFAIASAGLLRQPRRFSMLMVAKTRMSPSSQADCTARSVCTSLIGDLLGRGARRSAEVLARAFHLVPLSSSVLCSDRYVDPTLTHFWLGKWQWPLRGQNRDGAGAQPGCCDHCGRDFD